MFRLGNRFDKYLLLNVESPCYILNKDKIMRCKRKEETSRTYNKICRIDVFMSKKYNAVVGRVREREREREREMKEEIWMLRHEIGQKIETDFTFNVGYYFPLSDEYHIQHII